jgi:ABC-type Fe3+/spermidine/putrescine transport system ATPase subunit
MSNPHYLHIDSVSKHYPGGGGVSRIDLSVAEGEMLVLLGPSGCGKTTLLRTIAGLLRPDEGRIKLDGKDVTRVPTHKRNLTMVFQTWALFPTMTVAENVAFGLRMRHVPRSERQARVFEALTTVGLDEYSQRHPRELSGGQQQRVALARAIVTRPDVLLFDEPLSSLDHQIRVQLRGQIRRLQAGLGLTGVYVTHDHTEALAIGDRIAVMDAGRVVEVGAPLDVFTRPAHLYTAEFLGTSNVVPVTEVGDGKLRSDFGDAFAFEGRALESPIVAVALSPDAIRMRSFVEGRVLPVGGRVGTIVALEYQPTGVLHEVQLGGGASVRVITPLAQGLPPGTAVELCFDWDRAVPLID